MGDGRRAAVEFQKLLDHPGIVGRDVMGPWRCYRWQEPEKISGDNVAAREYYEQVLNLWKNADPDIPIYREAKAEEAELTSLH